MARAGHYRHWVEFQRRTEARGAAGDVTYEWQTYARVRAGVEAIRASERFAGGTDNPVLSHRVTCRYQGVLPCAHDRITYGDHVLEIVGPPMDRGGRHKEWVIDCLERARGSADG